MIKDSPLTTFPILQQTLANLFNGCTNCVRGALDINYPFRGLRKHLLGRDHARTRRVLYSLDFDTIATNDSAHEIVRNKKSD